MIKAGMKESLSTEGGSAFGGKIVSLWEMSRRDKNYKLKILCRGGRDGQSLIEVVIGLAIGSILIGAAAFAISTMLQTNIASQRGQMATALAQELLNKARVYGSADWQTLYGLTKASSTQYFLNASGTTYAVVNGKEGMLDNDVSNGLVGEWKFDENAAGTSTIVYDATGNGANGTFVGSPVRATSTCRIANCLVFATGSSVSVTAAPSVANTGTLSAWVYLNAWGANYDSIIFKGPGIGWASIDYGLFRYSNTNQFLGTLNNGTNSLAGAGPKSSLINLGQWYHLAFTWDGVNAKFYTNGVETGSVSFPYPAGARSQNMNIGAAVGGSSYPFNGMIDDVRIYNRALSADEVRQLWNSNIFSRYFYVENACRTSDASSSISGVASCGSGSSDDPSTQKVTAVTQWTTGAGSGQTLLSDFLTRWKNVIFQQSDWSGGAGASSPVTTPGNTFSSSSGANFGGGSIRIQGL